MVGVQQCFGAGAHGEAVTLSPLKFTFQADAVTQSCLAEGAEGPRCVGHVGLCLYQHLMFDRARESHVDYK